MRLVFKITLIYLSITLLIFIVGGVISYQVMKREIDLEEQRFLQGRLRELSSMIERRNLDSPFTREKISIIPLEGIVTETDIVFSDTLVMHQDLNRIEPHLRLDVTRKIGERYYEISIYDLIVEADDIEDGVRESLITMYLILFVVVMVLSWGVSVWILKPFNNALELIQIFDIRNKNPLKFPKSTTKEIRQLNSFLEEMTFKMQRDYQSLKEFSENASHEMQTPLAIAKGKLELLMEQGDLNEEQLNMIDAAYRSVSKLSRLGRSLSLLTKIENKEFVTKQEIDFSQILRQMIFNFKELLELKKISFEEEIADEVKLNLDKTLADILITNLLQNAIRHNYKNGLVRIKLDKQALVIGNTGKPLNIQNPDTFFTRFKKAEQSTESIGLGLSIVKKVCEVNQFDIDYAITENWHELKVSLSK